MKAAEILVTAIRPAVCVSRIATYIDQFPIPIPHLLRPLLHHPDAGVRVLGRDAAGAIQERTPGSSGSSRL